MIGTGKGADGRCSRGLLTAMTIDMTRTQVVETLRSHAEPIRGRGAVSLYLFGSVARGEETADSDIDLFLDYDEESRFSLVELVDLKLYLEEKLGLQVDLTTRDSLHPMLRDTIERTALRIF